MNVFTDLNVSKDLSIGIDGFTGNLSKKPYSHKGAWSRIIKCQLESLDHEVTILDKYEDWNKYDIMIIDMGMEYKGTLNLFGGASDELADRLKSIADYKGKIFTIEGQFPDVNQLIRDRLKSATDKFKNLILYAPDWERFHNNTKHIDLIYKSPNVIIGDSHVLSMWRPGYEIHRHDGKTMHGMLNTGLSKFVPDQVIHNLILYFGNIDIRHHLLREENPIESVELLIKEYFSQIDYVQKNRCIDNVSIVLPLPIENESRKIPKTGYYKGTPFYGTWEERNNMCERMKQLIHEYSYDRGIKTIHWPLWYKNMSKELSFDVMEKPKSVHLSPQYYFYDMDKNDFNNNYHLQDLQGGLF